MGKAAKWLRFLFTGKNDKGRFTQTKAGPIPTNRPPQEKKRWSFRRSVTMEKKSAHIRRCSDSDMYQRGAAAAAAAAADAAIIRLTERAAEAVEEVAAIKFQSVFRSYLARKALCALKGLVKLQALIRGHLVRSQTMATLRSMQAMVTAQARAWIQRLLAHEEAQAMSHYKQHAYKRSPCVSSNFPILEMDDKVKIVEMDVDKFKGSSMSRNNYHSYVQPERRDHRLTTYSASSTPYRRDPNQEVSPAQSSNAEGSLQAYSGHLAEYYFAEYLSASSINDSTNYPRFPNCMSKTVSSKVKARSFSAPKQRSDTCKRQLSKRRTSTDGRSVPQGYWHPQSIKLDRSSVSLQESECGSAGTALTNTKYCSSLMAYEDRGEPLSDPKSKK